MESAECVMHDEKEKERRRLCSNCGNVAYLLEAMLNPHTGNVVRVFRCGTCGSLEWDD